MAGYRLFSKHCSCFSKIANFSFFVIFLSLLLSDMNIAKELERIADYAVTIAKIVQKMPASEECRHPKFLKWQENALSC